MDDEVSGAVRPAWLEKARCSNLDSLATSVGAATVAAVTKTRAELGAISSDSGKSALAIDLETEVWLGAAEAELLDEIGGAIASSRKDLSQTISEAAIDCEGDEGKATLAAFDKDAERLQKAASSDFGAAVEGDAADGGGAVLSFAEKMKQARAKAAAAIKRAQALEAAEGPVAREPGASSSRDIHLRDRQSVRQTKNRSLKMAGFAAAGIAATAAVAIGVFSFSEKEASSAPLVDELAKTRDVAPLGAGSPERLRKFQEMRKERLERARAEEKRRSPARKKARKPVFTRPRRKANSAPVEPETRPDDDTADEPTDTAAEPGTEKSPAPAGAADE